jgi:hypothetical protein
MDAQVGVAHKHNKSCLPVYHLAVFWLAFSGDIRLTIKEISSLQMKRNKRITEA